MCWEKGKFMRKTFFKALAVAGALIFAWNCSDEPTGPKAPEYAVTSSPAWLLTTDTDYILYPDGKVTNPEGDIVGSIMFFENSSVGVLRVGDVVLDGVDVSVLPMLDSNTQVYTITASVFHYQEDDTDYLIYLPPEGGQISFVTDANGNNIGFFNFETNELLSPDGSGQVITTVDDILSQPVLHPGDKFTREPVSSSSEPESSSSDILIPISSVAPSSSSEKSSSSAKSSSSSAKSSSSSSVKSSSSSAQPSGGCPEIKYKSGGASGSGWATRYWDCCKPSCSWQENSGGNPARQCTNKGKTESTDWGGGSICSGGQLMTCTSQIPFTVSGCDNLGFAFAAVPASNGGQCGHCYELTFTGQGHYESTNANTKTLKSKGKKLIIMATNIGGDVQQGQFDIMIPGGGVGMFNGCSSMGWGAQGEQYGGLLSDCEKENNYAAGKMKSCLTNKCNSVFSGDSQAKEGCLFLANFLEAAGNPEHTFKEVECPDVLKKKY